MDGKLPGFEFDSWPFGIPSFDDIDLWEVILEFIKKHPKYEYAQEVMKKLKCEKEELMIKLYDGGVCMLKHHLQDRKKK